MLPHTAHAVTARRKGDRGRRARGRWSDLRFLVVLLLPALAIRDLLFASGSLVWHLLAVYSVVVLADAVVPVARRDTRDQSQAAGNSWLCSTVLRLYVPLHLSLQVIAGVTVWRLGWSAVLPVACCVGLICGALGVTVAHELGHSVYRFDRGLAWVLMGSVFYAQFMVEHYRGHHPRAATRRDAATARKGESLWRFLPRSIKGGTLHAWKLEARRLHQSRRAWGHSPLVWCAQANVLFVLATIVAMALPVLAFALLQAVIAVCLLESVNYIGHYGLQRLEQGVRIEKFKAIHAWSTNTFVGNALLLNVQHHADHHVSPWKAYPALVPQDNGPRLPTGYAGCVLLAMLPPLWFRVMDPRLMQARQRAGLQDLSTRPSVLMDRR